MGPDDSRNNSLPLPGETGGGAPPKPEEPDRDLRWVFFSEQGLRAGWSIAIFLAVFVPILFTVGTVLATLHLTHRGELSPRSGIFGELAPFLAMLGAATVVARIEQRRVLDFNLRGPGRPSRFVTGAAAGLLALSVLIGSLDWGGWLHFGPAALNGSAIVTNGLLFGIAFLLVGCVEEGMMRCYLLFTLTRGLNFWWAVVLVGAMCLDLIVLGKGEAVWGVYAMAVIGFVPCLALFLRRAPGASFWYATWVSSTFFGFGHTGNGGENWVGIFGVCAIGAVLCVSVKVTGSAWWAIGCHAAWDWGETYF